MEHLEEYIRSMAGRIERLEADTERLSRELARGVEGRQAEQDLVRRELSSAFDQMTARLSELPELRAQLESLSNGLRTGQTSQRELAARQEEAARRVETASARLDGFDGRLLENRRLAEQIGQEVGVVRGEVGRAIETLYALREKQQQLAEQTRGEISALRDSLSQPGLRLDRLEEMRRVDSAAVERLSSSIAQLSTADNGLRASIEKLQRVVSEDEARLSGDLAALRTEAGAALATVRQVWEERSARQQDELKSALTLAAQAQAIAESAQEATARLRSQLDVAVHHILAAERQRLERAADFAAQEFRTYDERTRSDVNGQSR